MGASLESRLQALELAQVALRNFPLGTVSWDRVQEFIGAVAPALDAVKAERAPPAGARTIDFVDWLAQLQGRG